MAKLQRMMMVLLCAGFLTTTALTGCSTESKAVKTTERIGSDSWITAKVKTAMADDLMLKTFAINVETFDGVVQLSGFVDNADQKRLAGEVAQKVEGVKSVKNDIRVKQ